ncbi:MAG: VanZ family protein [Phycisphaerales bacterium]|nr:MAG: VanZ family protein [Phycisphaerales bacterium]
MCLWIGYWLVLFIITHRRFESAPDFVPPGGDKAIHFLLYFVLAWLGWRYLRSAGRSITLSKLMLWFAIYVAYAAFDEWLQQFVGRHASVTDWAADVAGCLVATLVLARRGQSRTLSEHDSKSD